MVEAKRDNEFEIRKVENDLVSVADFDVLASTLLGHW